MSIFWQDINEADLTEWLSEFATEIIQQITYFADADHVHPQTHNQPISPITLMQEKEDHGQSNENVAISPRKVAAFAAATANENLLFAEINNITEYPVLLQHKINPKSQNDISRLMRDLWKLRKNVTSVDIFKFTAVNERQVTLIQVPSCSRRSRFYNNVTRSKDRNFVTNFLNAIVKKKINQVPMMIQMMEMMKLMVLKMRKASPFMMLPGGSCLILAKSTQHSL